MVWKGTSRATAESGCTEFIQLCSDWTINTSSSLHLAIRKETGGIGKASCSAVEGEVLLNKKGVQNQLHGIKDGSVICQKRGANVGVVCSCELEADEHAWSKLETGHIDVCTMAEKLVSW